MFRSVLSTDSALTLGRISGVPVRLGPGAAFIAILLAAQLASDWSAGSPDLVSWLVAIAAALGFLASVLAHEVGHTVVAHRFKVGVDEIRLTFLGGAAALERSAPSAKAEMTIAAAGPAVSILIGVATLGGAQFLDPSIATPALIWVGSINLILAAFNLLPALPLDGGRILTGFLWVRRGDRPSAVRTTARAGRGLAYLLYAVAIFEFFVIGSGFALITAVVGFVLRQGSDVELVNVERREAVAGLRVSDVANVDAPTISIDSNTAAARAMLPDPAKQRFAVVVDEEGVARGVVDIAVISQAADRNGLDPVINHMQPVDQHRASFSSELLANAMDRGVALPFVVIDGDWQPLGVVSRWLTPQTPIQPT